MMNDSEDKLKALLKTFGSNQPDPEHDFCFKFSDGAIIAGSVDKNALYPPLHQAVKDGDLQKVKSLIAQKEDVNFCDGKRENSGWPPLMWACRFGNTDIAVELINAGAGVNFIDEKGRSLLSEAISCGDNIDIVKILIDRGTSIDAAEEAWQKVMGGKELIELANSKASFIKLLNLGFILSQHSVDSYLAKNDEDIVKLLKSTSLIKFSANSSLFFRVKVGDKHSVASQTADIDQKNDSSAATPTNSSSVSSNSKSLH
jgi:ankyrin repeat protein